MELKIAKKKLEVFSGLDPVEEIVVKECKLWPLDNLLTGNIMIVNFVGLKHRWQHLMYD